MIVAKFGGTSVADRDAIVRLIAIIRAARQAAIQPESRDWRGPVVVVSALGGATDRLLGLAAEAGAGDIEGAREHVRALCARHLDVAGVITTDTEHAEVELFIRQEFDALDRVVGALGVLKEVSPRWMDAIAATGEILSSRIVAAALSSHGLAAGWVDARRAIVTNGEHTAAAPLWAETTTALRATVDPVLVQRRIPVVGGFVGATTAGVTTTLGRGGSDYSAAIIGACLDATEIQIWTDVDGMLTADPRIVPNTRVVPHLSFAEASELAYFGAKVLHPATIQPAVAKNIPVRILNSRRPLDSSGTLVTSERPPGAGPLTAVASKTGVTVVDIASTRMLMAHGFLRRIFETFESIRTPVDVVTTSEVSVSVTIDDARRVPEIVAALSEVADVTREDHMAILCAVGDGLQNDPAFVGRLLEAIEGVPVRMLSQAAARRNITLVISEQDLVPALRRVHERFFGAGAGGVPGGGRGRDIGRPDVTNLLLVGHGRMGQLVERLAPLHDCRVVGIVTEISPENALDEQDFGEVDVAVDFTVAGAVKPNLESMAARGWNVVIGTTGWQDDETECRAIVRKAGIAVLASANFSIGMQVFRQVVEEAARRFAGLSDVGAWIHESHHAAKKDAPSGTALLLKRAMEHAGYARPVDVSSTRAGSIPGTHQVGFDALAESVTLVHEVRDRAVFAHGALEAAKWLEGRRGWFSMADMLG